MPGDIVTSMNGLPMGTDGTFKDYCDVIRTAGEGAPIAVEVLRYDTSEVLKGEINGDEPLEPWRSPSPRRSVTRSATTPTPPRPPTTTSRSSTTPTRSRSTCPTAWTARDTAPVDRGRRHRRCRTSRPSTDLDGFINGFTAPGLLFAKLPATADLDASLAQYGFAGDCTDGGITDYSDPVFTGKYQVWQDCGGTTNDVVTLVAVPADGSYLAVIQAQIVTDADLEALQTGVRHLQQRVLTTTSPTDRPEPGLRARLRRVRTRPAIGPARPVRSAPDMRRIAPLAAVVAVPLLACCWPPATTAPRRRRRPTPSPSARLPGELADGADDRRRPRSRPSTTERTDRPRRPTRRSPTSDPSGRPGDRRTDARARPRADTEPDGPTVFAVELDRLVEDDVPDDARTSTCCATTPAASGSTVPRDWSDRRTEPSRLADGGTRHRRWPRRPT